MLRRVLEYPVAGRFLVSGIGESSAYSELGVRRCRAIAEACQESEASIAAFFKRLGSSTADKSLRLGLGIARDFLDSAEPEFSVEQFAQFVRIRAPRMAADALEIVGVALQVQILCMLLDALNDKLLGASEPPVTWISTRLLQLRSASNVAQQHLIKLIVGAHELLQLDPAGIYDEMDSYTQDVYNVAIRHKALRMDLSDVEAARATLQVAIELKCHIGFVLKEEIGLPNANRIRVRSVSYIVACVLLTGILVGLSLYIFIPKLSHWLNMMIFVCVTVLALTAAQDTLQELSIFRHKVAPILRMSKKYAGHHLKAPLVILIPCVLLSRGQINQMLERVEWNSEALTSIPAVFVLLSDFPDSKVGGDSTSIQRDLLNYLIQRVDQLNVTSDRVVLMHRELVFNGDNDTWMGWERKRGKIEFFNDLIVLAQNRFSLINGPIDCLLTASYAMVIDEDTLLVETSVDLLLRAALHPIYFPAISIDGTNAVEAGHGLWLAPTLATSDIRSTNADASIALDVLFESFGEAKYTGKGLFHIETYARVIKDRLPSNAVLSHDTIEGAALRPGIGAGMAFVERPPRSYYAHLSRMHRWIRGDWQNACAFLLPTVLKSRRLKAVRSVKLLGKFVIFTHLLRPLRILSFATLLIIALD